MDNIVLKILLILFFAIIGGLPCLYMVISMPSVLIWKIYRMFKYHISFWD